MSSFSKYLSYIKGVDLIISVSTPTSMYWSGYVRDISYPRCLNVELILRGTPVRKIRGRWPDCFPDYVNYESLALNDEDGIFAALERPN